MMDIHETCDSHFLLYVRQIMLCTLNLFSAICQLYFSKTGREKIQIHCDIDRRVDKQISGVEWRGQK